MRAVIASVVLTTKEELIVRRYAQGESHNEISMALAIEPKTVTVHLRNACDKLGLKATRQLCGYAVKVGWLTL